MFKWAVKYVTVQASIVYEIKKLIINKRDIYERLFMINKF